MGDPTQLLATDGFALFIFWLHENISKFTLICKTGKKNEHTNFLPWLIIRVSSRLQIETPILGYAIFN